MTSLLRGAFAAALTPLRDGGAALDEAAFAPYADFLVAGGVDGMLVCGTTGEGLLLSLDERRRVAELYIGRPAGACRWPCTAAPSRPADTALLAAHAAEAGAAAVAVIAPPFFPLDEAALLAHFGAAAAACAPLPFYVYEFAVRSGYAVPIAVIERLRETAPNLRGLKVSDKPWEAVEPYLLDGLDVFIGAEALVARGLAAGAAGAVSGLASVYPGGRRRARARADGRAFARGRAAARRARALPVPRLREGGAGEEGRADRRRRPRAAAAADRRRAGGARPAVILVAGAGAMGASIAYHLALRGRRRRRALRPRRDRRRLDVARDGRGAAAVLDRAGGRARAREHRLLRGAGRAVLPSGRLPLPRDDGGGARGARGADALQEQLGVAVERVDASFVRGLAVDDVLGAAFGPKDGTADPGGRGARAGAARGRARRRGAGEHRRGEARRRGRTRS